MKLKYETPYIMELELNDNKHLIVKKSDGTVEDVGYFPQNGITIHRKEERVIE